MIRIVVGVVLAVVFSLPAAAQGLIAVSGTVRDVSGGVLPGASVEAVVADRVIAVATANEAGRFQLEVPARVPFQLRVRLEGFVDQIVELPGSSMPVGRDIVLQVGRLSDTLVVTASRTLESRASITQSVTIATARDIHALGSQSLADIVRFVPGVAVEGTGREGALTSMFTRGGESDYNLVLIDGVRVNQNGGYFDFSRISAHEIDRVEVVRGAQSSLWGSDAIGSVVQIFTRRAGVTDAARVSGSIEGGSFETWRGEARAAGGLMGRFDYHGGVWHRRTGGAFAELLPEDDEFEQTGVDAGIGGALGTRASFRTSARYTRAQGRSVGPIAYGSRDTGTLYETKDFSWTASLSHTAGARYSGTGTVSYFRYDSRSEDTIADPPFTVYAILEGTPNARFPNGMRLVRLITASEFASLAAAGAMPAPGQVLASSQQFDFPFRSLAELRRPAVRYQGDLTWVAGQRLSFGYEWEREHRPQQMTPARLPELTNDNNAVFVQQQFSLMDRWFVAVGARADSRQAYDTFFSPKLSVGGFLVPARRGALSSLKVFGNIGRGIKSPTFAERFGASFADPNPNLKVERARTADIGVEATVADERIRGVVTYFNNDYNDQIAYRFGTVGDGIPEFINIDGSKADGWEVELALQRSVAGVTASVTYALVDTEVVTTLSTSQQFQPGQPLLRRPKHSGTIRVSYSIDRLAVNFDTRWVGDRHDNSFLFLRTVANATRPAFTTDITVNPGYAVAGLGIDYAIARTATAYLRFNNLTDTTYESALGYSGMPRSVMAGLRFDLGR